MVLLLIFSFRQQKETYIFLCIGQSNMAGRAEIMPEDTLTLKNVYLFNDNQEWEPSKNPLNRYSTVRKALSMQKLGPSWSFSKKMDESLKGVNIGLVVNAIGGSSIDEWKKGGIYYDEALIRALQAQKKGVIKGIIWHQGGSDRTKWESYTEKFVEMIANFRKDLSIPDLPVIAGQVGQWKESSTNINKVISELKYHIKNVDYVSSEGLNHIGDSTHFNGASQRVFGERYANKFLEMTKSK